MRSFDCISDSIKIRKICQQICCGKDEIGKTNSDPDVTSGKVKSAFVLPLRDIRGVHSCPVTLRQPGRCRAV